METMKDYQLNHLIGQKWARLIVKCSVLLIIPNLEDNLVIRNMHYLVYLRDPSKAYPNISCLAVMKDVLNANNLELMIENIKESMSLSRGGTEGFKKMEHFRLISTSAWKKSEPSNKEKFVSSYLGILYLAPKISNPYMNFEIRRHKNIALAPWN